MELIILSSILAILCVKFYLDKREAEKEAEKKAKQIYAKQLDELQFKVNYLEENKLDPREVVSLTEHDRIKEELHFQLSTYKDYTQELQLELSQSQEKNSKLVSQRQSNHVKLGQIAEHFYPFLETFPYDPKKCTSILAPIDILYFGQDEIVFIEIKSGGSQLSPKQRTIKSLIDQKKVRFETHRINQKGVEIK